MFLLKVIPADHVPSFLISVLQVLLCIFCSLAVYLFLSFFLSSFNIFVFLNLYAPSSFSGVLVQHLF